MSEDDKPFVCNIPGCGQVCLIGFLNNGVNNTGAKMPTHQMEEICYKSFTNEDHLSVHKHKHEMTLKFGPPKSDAVVVADQTPTPTRFLKNCEEVGLFHELASPFDKLEHEFKKAQEEEDKKLVLGLPAPSLAEPSTKDGEHVAMETSQPCGSSAQPESISSSSSKEKEASFPAVPEVALPLRPSSLLLPSPTRSPCMVIQQTMPSPNSPSVITQAPPAHQQHVAPVPGSLPVILQLPNGQAVSVSLPASAATSPTLPVAAAYPEQPITIQVPAVVSNVPGIPGPSLGSLASPSSQAARTTPPGSHQQPPGVTTRLKAMLTEGSPQNGGVEVLSQAVEMVIAQQDSHPPQLSLHIPQPQALSEPQPSPTVSTPGSSSSGCGGGSGPGVEPSKSTGPAAAAGGGRRRRSAITDPEERRRRFLERNRAAASRCRQKRKLWVMDLERRAEDLAHTNVELQKEVTELRGELAHLKQLLLAHKDCPVTALQKEAQAFLGAIMESQESTAAAVVATATSNKSSAPLTDTAAEGCDRSPDTRLLTVDASALSMPGGGQPVSGSS